MLEALRRLTPGLEIPERIDYRLELIRKNQLTKFVDKKDVNWMQLLSLLKILRIHVIDTVELLSKMSMAEIPPPARPSGVKEISSVQRTIHVRKIQKY